MTQGLYTEWWPSSGDMVYEGLLLLHVVLSFLCVWSVRNMLRVAWTRLASVSGISLRVTILWKGASSRWVVVMPVWHVLVQVVPGASVSWKIEQTDVVVVGGAECVSLVVARASVTVGSVVWLGLVKSSMMMEDVRVVVTCCVVLNFSLTWWLPIKSRAPFWRSLVQCGVHPKGL